MNKTPQAKRVPSRKVGKSKLALVVLCVYWPAIFVASHIPKQMVPEGWSVSGLKVHVAAYSVLTLLVFAGAGLLWRTSLCSKKAWVLVGLISGYAAGDELLQLLSQGRSGNLADWAIDTATCLVCVLLLALLAKLINQRTGV